MVGYGAGCSHKTVFTKKRVLSERPIFGPRLNVLKYFEDLALNVLKTFLNIGFIIVFSIVHPQH